MVTGVPFGGAYPAQEFNTTLNLDTLELPAGIVKKEFFLSRSYTLEKSIDVPCSYGIKTVQINGSDYWVNGSTLTPPVTSVTVSVEEVHTDPARVEVTSFQGGGTPADQVTKLAKYHDCLLVLKATYTVTFEGLGAPPSALVSDEREACTAVLIEAYGTPTLIAGSAVTVNKTGFDGFLRLTTKNVPRAEWNRWGAELKWDVENTDTDYTDHIEDIVLISAGEISAYGDIYAIQRTITFGVDANTRLEERVTVWDTAD